MLKQRRAGIPGHAGPARREVLAPQRRNGNGADVGEPKLLREGAIVLVDGVEDVLIVADGVHLVDGEHDRLDAEEVDDAAVPARLDLQALSGIDQDHGQVRGRGARHHVAGILLVPRRIGDDELALGRREIAVGDVDRDALLAFGLQAVDKKGEIDLLARRTVGAAVALDGKKRVLENQLTVVKQAADEGALAVVDAAAGEEAQHRHGAFAGGFRGRSLAAFRHQKYPSSFFFSIELPWSRSMTRPWRSEARVTISSSMISWMFAAVEATALVSG